MKRILSILTAITVFAGSAVADEGMWLLPLIQKMNSQALKDAGCELTPKQIYDINNTSLKDAIVQFGGGCTGEIISSEGLLVTNHHCGYGNIQKLSSVEHDYLKNGYWAMNRSEELPCEGLTVTFLESMKDVTSMIEKAQKKGEDLNEVIARLTDEAKKNNPGCKIQVTSFYNNNVYYLIVYKVYTDVRFVGAPPSSIGKFGADTDNWMWPRHTGDFSMFRIYADKDNNPAPYSKDNVPYKPKKYFRISTAGVQEGDFTFIYGFPGRTQEYIHSEGVRYIEEIGDPHKIHLRTLRLDIMSKYQSQSQKVRIQYSSKHAGVANAWKKWQGEVKGIRKMKTVQTKKEFEAAFDRWAAGGEFNGVLAKIEGLYRDLEPYQFATDYYSETVRTIEMADLALDIASLYIEGHEEGVVNFDQQKAREIMEAFYKDWYLPIDKECFIAVMNEYEKNVPAEFKPEYYKEQLAAYGSIEAWAENMFTNSIFCSPEKALGLTAEDKDRVIADPATQFLNEFNIWFANEIRPVTSRLNQELQLAYRDYMRGQMVYCRTQRVPKAFYPDANLTLRVAYGHIKGYSPADGTYYKPSSTIKGIMEKDNPDIFDYNIPQRLRDIYASKDYGRWADATGEVPVCFIATNHTTGGNSGSPVINADGDLIGLNFDRVWEGTMSDIVFDPEICRNIALDVRYVLFTIEKIGGASYLFDEMVFVE